MLCIVPSSTSRVARASPSSRIANSRVPEQMSVRLWSETRIYSRRACESNCCPYWIIAATGSGYSCPTARRDGRLRGAGKAVHLWGRNGRLGRAPWRYLRIRSRRSGASANYWGRLIWSLLKKARFAETGYRRMAVSQVPWLVQILAVMASCASYWENPVDRSCKHSRLAGSVNGGGLFVQPSGIPLS